MAVILRVVYSFNLIDSCLAYRFDADRELLKGFGSGTLQAPTTNVTVDDGTGNATTIQERDRLWQALSEGVQGAIVSSKDDELTPQVGHRSQALEVDLQAGHRSDTLEKSVLSEMNASSWRSAKEQGDDHLLRVVGGAGKGIKVYSSESETQPSGYIQYGAILKELGRNGTLIEYELVSGEGPAIGWVRVDDTLDRLNGTFLRVVHLLRVVGGAGKGIQVYSSESETQPSGYIQYGAILKELGKNGTLIKYELVSGAGPAIGWVNESSERRESSSIPLVRRVDNYNKTQQCKLRRRRNITLCLCRNIDEILGSCDGDIKKVCKKWANNCRPMSIECGENSATCELHLTSRVPSAPAPVLFLFFFFGLLATCQLYFSINARRTG